MRVLILGVSTLALGACSMGGGGWSHHQGQGVHSQYAGSGHYSSNCGVAVDPCATSYVQAPVVNTPVYAPAPAPVPAPVYEPAPVHHASPCAVDPCSAGTYAVSPYAPAAGQIHTPDAHAYGSYHNQGYAQSHGYAPTLRGAHRVGNDGRFYGTLGVALVDVEESAVALQGRLGYQATEIFGAEVEGTVGILSDTEDLGGGDELRTSIDYGAGIFATARVPVGDRFNVFARGGYHVTEVSQTLDVGGVETEASDTIDDFAYGAGVEYELNARDSIRADYTRYEGGDTFSAQDSVSLAWLRRF